MTQSATESPAEQQSTNAAPAICVEKLTHRYTKRKQPSRRERRNATVQALQASSQVRDAALDALSLEVQSGEIFGILGPNGSGKSTLFRILSTLLQPSDTSAAVELFGINVLHDPAAARQQLGVVFQSPSLDDQLTVEENLHAAGTLYGLGGATLREQINQWLDRMRLADRRDDRVHTLSGGLQRRVELAKAMLHQPRLLLLDEPSTGLDVAARRQLWQHLRDLRSEHGVTIALTTHLMDEAEHCDRLAILHEGKRVALDTVDALKSIIGGEVVILEPQRVHDRAFTSEAEGQKLESTPIADASADQLAMQISERFAPWPDGGSPTIVEGCIRFEHTEGAQLVAQIASAWPNQIRSFTVGRPTLEDVFLHLTGERFEG